MLLNYIELQGFGSYEDFIHWDIPMGITGIIGTFDENEKKSNGAGKSTLISSILYTLFGEGEYEILEDLVNDKVKSKKGHMFTRLSFNLKNIEYLIERGIKSKASYLDFYTIDSSGNKNRVGDDSTTIGKTQENILNVLAMGYPMLSASGFFEQNKLDKFVNVEPSVRRSYTDKVFDLENWRSALKLAVSKLTELKNKIANLMKTISDQETKEKELVVKLKELIVKEKDLEVATKDKQEKEQEFSKYEKAYPILSRITFNQSVVDANTFKLQENAKEVISKEAALANLQKKEKAVPEENSKKLLEQASSKKTEGAVKIKQLTDEIEKENKVLNSIVVAIAESNTEIKLENSKKLSEDTEYCPVCRQDITQDHIEVENTKILQRVSELQEKVQGEEQKKLEQTAKIKKLVDDKKIQDDALRLLDIEIENLNKKIHQKDIDALALKKDIKSIQDSLEEFNKSKQELDLANKQASEELIKDNKELQQIFPNGMIDLSSLKEFINDINNNIIELTKQITELKTIQKEHISLKKDLEKNKSDLKILQEDLYFSELGTNLFKDIPTTIFKESIEEVETAANNIIQRVLPTLQVKIWEDLDKKARKLMISFISDGYPRSYDRLSGGEKTVANIGIRLGYSQVITARANTSIDFIVLDEPFGALDEENRDLVKKVFAIISQWFTQILVISHDDSIENFPNVLRIGKTAEGCSYILN